MNFQKKFLNTLTGYSEDSEIFPNKNEKFLEGFSNRFYNFEGLKRWMKEWMNHVS